MNYATFILNAIQRVLKNGGSSYGRCEESLRTLTTFNIKILDWVYTMQSTWSGQPATYSCKLAIEGYPGYTISVYGHVASLYWISVDYAKY